MTAPEDQILDPFDENPPKWAHLPASEVVRMVFGREGGGGGLLRRRVTAPPVVRITDRYLTGTLDLRGVEFPYLFEFFRCRFEEPPDLRSAIIDGFEFSQCWLPGLEGRNLTSNNDLSLTNGTRIDGTVDVTDASVHGSLVLRDTRLSNPGGLALRADRVQLVGAFEAAGLEAEGELRIAGMRTGGDVDFSGAKLNNPTGLTINGDGLRVGASLRCDPDSGTRFESTGRISLTGSIIEANFSMRGAHLKPNNKIARIDDPFLDPLATLIADRINVSGDVDLHEGLESTGTLRIVNAYVGGVLRLARASVAVRDLRALHMNGTEIRGGLDARHARVIGQISLIDVSIQGDVLLNETTLVNPDDVALMARRLRAGGSVYAQNLRVDGSMILPNARIGVDFFLRSSTFRHPHPLRPSLDLRDGRVGEHLVLYGLNSSGSVSVQGVKVGRLVNLSDAELGADLDAANLDTRELWLDIATPARGNISLRHAHCVALGDNEAFWASEGPFDLDGFRYDALAESIGLGDDEQIQLRLKWLRHAMRNNYLPGPYDQLAAMLRASGNEEHAATVLMAKQMWR